MNWGLSPAFTRQPSRRFSAGRRDPTQFPPNSRSSPAGPSLAEASRPLAAEAGTPTSPVAHVRRRRGTVLIVVLLLSAGLAAAALWFGHSAMLRYRREANRQSAVAADLAADGALRYVEQVLTAATSGTLPDTTTYQAADLSIGDCRVWLLGRSDDLTADTPVFALQDEAGRLNLNTAPLELLTALPGMTVDLAGAIVDWRDPDSNLSPNGAESETYLALDPPYVAKNAPFESVAELRLLRGADLALLTGRDRNCNGILESWEQALANSARQFLQVVPDHGLADCATIYSREPNTSADGRPRTNLNGNAQAVRTALVELFGETRGATIATTAGVGTAQFGSVLEFCLKGRLSDSEAAAALDRLTTVTGTTISGRINVNTASAAVLACLPGVGVDNAAKLVAYRRQRVGTVSGVGWVAGVLGEATAIGVGPYVTDRSYQVTADIVAVGPRGRAFRRTCVVLDTTSGTPVVISRRDLTHLGWPLGAALRAELTKQAEKDAA